MSRLSTAVILDYGNVLSLPQDVQLLDIMAGRLGVSLDAFRDAYQQRRGSYDTAAIPAAEYWQQVLEILDRPSMGTASMVAWLIDRDIESWTRYREEVWELVGLIRGRGHRAAILSNCPREILLRIRSDRSLESRFDALIFSCEVGLAKPDPQIYQTCIRALGVNAGDALFVDDLPANITTAAHLGLRTYRFAGDDPVNQLRLLLESA